MDPGTRKRIEELRVQTEGDGKTHIATYYWPTGEYGDRNNCWIAVYISDPEKMLWGKDSADAAAKLALELGVDDYETTLIV